MTNFDELKQKAKDTMESIADKSIELYKIAEEKTIIIAKTTKLTTDIALEKGAIRKLYREIGQKYYEMHKTAPESELAQACAEVAFAYERINAKQKEIDELKNSFDISDFEPDDEDDDVEVEIIIEDLDKCCTADNDVDIPDEPTDDTEKPLDL